MKKNRIFFAIFVLAIILGCSKEPTFEEIIEERIKEDVREILKERSVNINKDLLHSISDCTNNSLRIKLLIKWGEDVLAANMPMQTNDYFALSRIIGRVEDRIRQEVTWGLMDACDGAKLKAFEMRFKLMDWQKRRMEEMLDISGTVAKDGYHDMMWRDCYTGLFLAYRSNICMMESKWYPYDLDVRKTPQDEKDRIKNMIETYFGRKIKKPEEVDRQWETETFRKVSKRQLP